MGAIVPLTSGEIAMSINNQKLSYLMQQTASRALLYALMLVGIHSALPGSVYAQAVQPLIAYGQTVQGVLGSPGDDVLPDGRPSDRARLVTRGPEPYVIRAAFPQIPVVSSISFRDTANQQTVPLQQAQVFASGQQRHERMMRGMEGMGWVMGLFGLLVLILVVLGIAALIKYLLSGRR